MRVWVFAYLLSLSCLGVSAWLVTFGQQVLDDQMEEMHGLLLGCMKLAFGST